MMLTCEELDGFIEKLCDLTRQMDDLDRAREATELLELIESIPQRFLMQWRAAAVADLYYLDGVSLRKIAPHVGLSFQAVSAWLRDYGPRQYLSLVEEAGVIRPVLFDVDEHTRTKIRQYLAAGRRIVPATENVIDPGSPTGLRAGIDLHRLWHRSG